MPSADVVDTLVRECLYRPDEIETPGEPPEGAIVAEGIIANFGFNPDRLEANRDEIVEQLSTLPIEFFTGERGGGGGWSFLQACLDNKGEQWTGFHPTMEALFALGMAIDVVACPMPREFWEVLPGGVPYYVVDVEPEVV